MRGLVSQHSVDGANTLIPRLFPTLVYALGHTRVIVKWGAEQQEHPEPYA
jgi:hypothetical protein